MIPKIHIQPAGDRKPQHTIGRACFGLILSLSLLFTSVASSGLAANVEITADGASTSEPSRESQWSGLYVGAHVGFAGGTSDWAAAHIASAVPPFNGSLGFGKGFNFSKGTGSYFGGFQAGYNYMFPSRLVVGVESDVSFPNTIRATDKFVSTTGGEASYGETVEYFGSARGRIGYALGSWLLYGTGGFAWSYDEFTRSQINGIASGGSAEPGTSESTLRARTGWAAGAGAEVALAPNWSARLEYLFADLGRIGVTFPAGAQRFTSNLSLHQVRLGVDYNFGEGSTRWNDLVKDNFSVHWQSTFVNQYAPGFRDPYRGPNSFITKTGRQTWDATLYLGVRLWEGAEFWINPEIDQGFGLSKTVGVAGFTSGEAYKVGNNFPYARVPRMFARQTINVSGETEQVDGTLNQFAGSRSSNRLVITTGKFAVTDVFDINKYAHDPRSDFLNWAIVDTGTFDYAADSWAYTYGTAIEWYQSSWTLRSGVFDLSVAPNSAVLDPGFRQFQLVFETERRYALWGQPGKLAVTGYLSRGRMGRFRDAVRLAAETGNPADTAAVRRYTSRDGISLNAEQQLFSDLGLFVRAGLANSNVEPYEFTDIDTTLVLGLSASGERWGRADDTLAIAGVVNGISQNHRRYLNAGGLGILVGDGRLPHAGPEHIVEGYYKMKIARGLFATTDVQYVANPAYNKDRGPVWIPGFRLHAEF